MSDDKSTFRIMSEEWNRVQAALVDYCNGASSESARQEILDVLRATPNEELPNKKGTSQDNGGEDREKTVIEQEQFGLLLQALNNYNQEIGGAEHEEQSFRDGDGVIDAVIIEDIDRGITPGVVQYSHLSSNDDRYSGLVRELESCGIEFENNWYVCECGEVSMPSDPMEEPKHCDGCDAIIPSFSEL